MTRRLVTVASLGAAVLAIAAPARAQVSIAVPNIQNPINKANGAVAKTNEQTRAAERVSKVEPGPAAAAQMADQQKQKVASRLGGMAQALHETARGLEGRNVVAGRYADMADTEFGIRSSWHAHIGERMREAAAEIERLHTITEDNLYD